MAIKLDEARVRLLKITDTNGNRHISFSRGSYNYIAAPSNGVIGLIANDTLSAAGCAMVIATNSIYPGTTNTVNLGTSSYKWANVYATTFTGNLSGNATSATSATSASSLQGTTSSSAVPLTDPGAGTIKYYYNVNHGLTGNMPSSNNANGILYLNTHSGEYGYQLGFSSDGNIYYRNKGSSAFTSSITWNKILSSNNYTSYTVTKTGSGASGNWGINITGSAAKLTTPRAINGTNFDGSSNITTANWGTARTLTIGDVVKSVNGSTNYTWSNNELRFIKWDDALSNAKLMYKDPMFYSGLNGMQVYNNSGGSHVTVTRITSPSGCPTPSGYCAQIQTIGTTTSPGYGGFYQSYTGRANAVFLIRYLIKLPVGYKLVTATNSMGDGYSDTFITDSAGTGNWTWYIRRVKCGSTGSFSSGGHVYVASNGATTTPSSSSPITWYVGAIYCYDLSASIYTGNNFIDTNVTSAKYLIDKTNGTATYLNYGAAGLSTTSWFAAWNGYELRTISPAVSRATMSAMSATSANGYYGMGTPDGTTSTWIRTTTLGIIPYNSGGASALGTSSWPFSNAYINIVYGNLSGTASYATADTSGNTITTSYLRRYDWWTSGNGNNVDTLRAGTTFAYNNHSAPATGTIVAFDCRGNENYTLQLMGAYQDTVNHLYFRNRNGDGNKWGAWRTVLDDNNYTSYTVTKTGSGASGTWGISISGNAATASSVAWGNVTGKPGSRFVTYYNSNSEMSSTESVSAESYIHTVGATGGAVTTTTKPNGMDNAWGIIHLHLHSGNHAMQLGFGGTTGNLYQRHAYASSTFGAWKTILDSSNYTSYTVTKTGTGASGTWGISISGNAATATKLGAGAATWAYFENTDELNFGGTATSTTLYMAYRSKDSRPIPTKFVFGGSSGSANLQCNVVYLGSGTSSYISSTQYTGNAATASAWATARTLTLAGDLSGSVSVKGNADMTLTATVKDDSHNHVISNIDNLQTNLDNKAGGSNYVDIVVGGDANTYYPVVLANVAGYYPMQFVNISRTYSEAAPDTWNTSTHRGGLTMTLLWNGSRYWDGNGAGSPCYCVYKYESYCTMIGGLGNSTSGIVVWLRGGTANYHIHSLNGKAMTATVYLTTYTDSASQSFAPKTTPSEISVRWPGYAKNADYATSAGSSTTSTTATSATKDGESNTIHSTYLKKSGGAVSGRVYSSATVAPANASFRNIKVVAPSTTITAGTTAIPDGEIWIRYE